MSKAGKTKVHVGQEGGSAGIAISIIELKRRSAEWILDKIYVAEEAQDYRLGEDWRRAAAAKNAELVPLIFRDDFEPIEATFTTNKMRRQEPRSLSEHEEGIGLIESSEDTNNH